MGGQKPSPSDSSKGQENNTVFISYAREDFNAAKKLYKDLKKTNLNPWLDQESILPGKNWENEIREAIKNSRYFIAVLSSNSVAKRGWVQRELKNALDKQEEFLETDVYIIPVRLDDCNISDQRLRKIQYADLFPDWNNGIERILQVVKVEEQPRRQQQPTHVDKIKNELENSLVNRELEIKDHRPPKPRPIDKRILTLIVVAVVASILAFIVFNYFNQPPIARAGFDHVGQWFSSNSSGNLVTLDARGSSSPKGRISSYFWTQLGEPFVRLNSSSSPVVSFQTPAVPTNTTLTFNLTVTDDKGQTGFNTIKIPVKYYPPLFTHPLLKAENMTVSTPDQCSPVTFVLNVTDKYKGDKLNFTVTKPIHGTIERPDSATRALTYSPFLVYNSTFGSREYSNPICNPYFTGNRAAFDPPFTHDSFAFKVIDNSTGAESNFGIVSIKIQK